MRCPNLILLYVDNPLASATLYSDLFGKEPTDIHPTFVSFTLESDLMVGLWSKHTAQPTALTTGGGGELCFSAADEQTVNLMYQQWTHKGCRVAQKPIMLDFGYTFVVLDPDGHRLRVFHPKS